ncbi:hypothetical protein Taro_002317 [Colocasia esculenta]|uniref:non-specific serine/threonine protein kinase n=1 Tax=Colocasia esculenta TaxID=4460 RepID=A0A843TL83_COLES|nr:hypothetical protein [Colocasia esculenta]
MVFQWSIYWTKRLASILLVMRDRERKEGKDGREREGRRNLTGKRDRRWEYRLRTLSFQGTTLGLLTRVSLAARQLIHGLLQRDPASRLGSNTGANEIKQHPFFRDINWPLVRCMYYKNGRIAGLQESRRSVFPAYFCPYPSDKPACRRRPPPEILTSLEMFIACCPSRWPRRGRQCLRRCLQCIVVKADA